MAVSKKQDKAAAGAPAWMVTYGDMVTLLLTFFVLLLAMSEVKQDQRLADFMQAIRETFGYVGGVKHLPTKEVHAPKNVDLATVLIMPIHPENFSQSNDEGPMGKRTRVEIIRPGKHYRAGGKVHFAELSAALSAAEARRIAQYAANELRGYATQIEVRGHCSKLPVDGTPFADHHDLSVRRARAVLDVLIAAGIDPRRIIVVGAGTNQPVTRDAYDPVERAKNDVVELLQTDKTIEDFRP